MVQITTCCWGAKTTSRISLARIGGWEAAFIPHQLKLLKENEDMDGHGAARLNVSLFKCRELSKASSSTSVQTRSSKPWDNPKKHATNIRAKVPNLSSDQIKKLFQRKRPSGVQNRGNLFIQVSEAIHKGAGRVTREVLETTQKEQTWDVSPLPYKLSNCQKLKGSQDACENMTN